jgi:hypothetical protein
LKAVRKLLNFCWSLVQDFFNFFLNRSKLFLFAVWELARFWYKSTLRSPAWVHILSGRFTQSSSCSYFSL